MTNPENTAEQGIFANLEDNREEAASYLSVFIDEAQTTLDELIEALLALEGGGGRKNVEQLFVAAHRMKGSAACIGLHRPAKLSHLMEDLLQILVDRNQTPTPQVTDALLSCADGLRQYVQTLIDGRNDEDNFEALAHVLLKAQSTGGDNLAPSLPNDSADSPAISSEMLLEKGETSQVEQVRHEESIPNKSQGISPELRQRLDEQIPPEERDNVLIGQILFEPNLALAGLKAQLIHSKLSNLGNICHFDPPVAETDNLEDLRMVSFGVVTDKSPEVLRGMLQIAGVQELFIEPMERRLVPIAPAPKKRGGQTEAGPKPAETMRVDIERLDQLMNLAGQLAIGKARITQISDKLKKSVSERDFISSRDDVSDLFEAIHLLDRVSDGIQQGVMNMRMLPIGPLFARFHRVIRDLTHSNGKDIRLEISGENTELDKRMIDELGDPMIHIIRNAADHGIESPAIRTAAGKPRHGTISLSAFHRGSNIVIRVSDDGHGLDAERIREKAVARGLISAAEAERLNLKQTYQLIFLPGLSTAEKVTEVSGRGVGMDIVRSKIDELSGTIDVESELGRGTSITIKLPLTLAILPSLLVEIDNDVFAIPMESVVEIVNVGSCDVNTVQGRRMAFVRERIISVLTLESVFDWRRREDRVGKPEQESSTLVIIGEGNRQLGLAVDNVLGEEDVVIKSIADNYRNVTGIAGASILGDGRVSLILDPPTLIEMSSNSGIAAAAT
jgi:two-component system, chemotaxis family, sensor kinase CheA